jgi:hypothetical protein
MIAELADGEPERLSALADGSVSELALGSAVKNLPDGVPVQLGDSGEVFLIPAAFLNQSSDLVGQVSTRPSRYRIHPCALFGRRRQRQSAELDDSTPTILMPR